MPNSTYILEMIDQALLRVHTGFVAKVVETDGNTATVQPLNMIKALGGQPQPSALVMNCPILSGAVRLETFTCEHTGKVCASVRAPEAGDIVYCACADRDIAETRKGTMAVPAIGHHMLSSAVVIGILQGG